MMGTEGDTQPNPLADAQERLDGNVRTVADLGEEIAAFVEQSGPSFDYVVGDATDVGTSSNGHCYFDLVHGDATLDCVAFQNQRQRFSDEIEEDARVAVAGDLTFYAPHGDVNVQVSDVVVLGTGEYDAVYEQNRSEHDADGLLDEDAKQPLPDHPKRVGLVTSRDSDAREDAVTSIHERHPGVEILVQDAAVQGENALPSLLQGLRDLEMNPSVDVIVVTRGGGADKTSECSTNSVSVGPSPARTRRPSSRSGTNVTRSSLARSQTLAR